MPRTLALLLVGLIPAALIIVEIFDFDIPRPLPTVAVVLVFSMCLYLSNALSGEAAKVSDMQRQLLLSIPIDPENHYQMALSLGQEYPIRAGVESQVFVSIVGRALHMQPHMVMVQIAGSPASIRQNDDDALSSDFAMMPTPQIGANAISYAFAELKFNPREPLNAFHLAFRVKCGEPCQLSITVNAVHWGDMMLTGKCQGLFTVH